MTNLVANPLPFIASVLLIACLAGQVVHGYLRIMHSNPHVRRLVALYEGALLVHLAIMSALTVGIMRYGTGPSFDALASPIPFIPALWLNIGVAGIGAYIALSDPEDTGEPDGTGWMPAVEGLIACLCTPVVLSLISDYQAVVLVVDALYFIARTAYYLSCDRKNRYKIVSPITMVDALKLLPEGILYADEQGRTILANDAMRDCLSQLGLAGDMKNMDAIWNKLNEKARTTHAVHVIERLEREPGAWTVLRMDDGEARLFAFEGAGFETKRRYPTPRPLSVDTAQSDIARRILGAIPRSRIIAYDITEEVETLEEIERTNEELAASQRDLKASADTAREAASNEAMLRMRGRVHDVIGQRLSMLHRALEDGDISDERLDQLKPLLTGILEDLAADMHADAAEELAATVDAFALAGVSIEVRGSLPEDERRAKLFADCVREATTNAVKHARARTVTVTMDSVSLEIANDGMSPAHPIEEGAGLANMRHAIEAEGGTFAITLTPFTLHVHFERVTLGG